MRWKGLAVLVIGVVLGTSAGLWAAEMDEEFTDGGGRLPFSTRLVDTSMFWELFSHPLVITPPTETKEGDVFVFSEPGMGNPVRDPRGHILVYEPVPYIHGRIVVDVLAWMPQVQLLFIDFPIYQSEEPRRYPAFSGYIGVYAGGPAPLYSSRAVPGGIPVVIPEPATVVLVGAGLGMIWRGRRREG